MMRKQDKNFKAENIQRIWNEKTKTRNKGYVLNCTSILFYFIISVVYYAYCEKHLHLYFTSSVRKWIGSSYIIFFD